MALVSNFQKLSPMMLRVTRLESITETDKQFLNSFQNSPSYEKLPKSLETAELTGQTNLFLLKKAADTLHLFVTKDIASALEIARETLKLKLGVDPFRGFFYNFVAKLAEFIGDEVTQIDFEARYKTYQEIYYLEGVLLGAEQTFNPEVMDLFDEILAAETQTQDTQIIPESSSLSELGKSLPTLPISQVGYVARVEEQNPKVMIFTKPKVASFVSFESELINIESSYEFLDIDFELLPNEESAELLSSFKDGNWKLRLIPSEETNPWVFSGNKIDEIDFSFNKIHLTLEQPESWLELSMNQAIDWRKLWFGLSTVVFIIKQ